MGVLTHPITLDQRGTFSMSSSRSASRLSVTFDDDHAVADAGLVLVAVLAERLGAEAVRQVEPRQRQARVHGVFGLQPRRCRRIFSGFSR